MKELLLILLCLPMIGFGKSQDRKAFLSFQIGANRLIPFNSQYKLGRTNNVHANTGISTTLSYKKYIKNNVNYIPSISFNVVSFTRRIDKAGISEYNSNFSLLSIGNGIGHDINNRMSISAAISFDILLKDKGTYTVSWEELTFGDMIDPQYGFVYPATVGDMPIGTTVRDYERDKLGYYSSFNVKFSYVIYQKIKSSYFVFFNFNVPFYYSQQPEQSNLLNANSISPEKQLNLQFNRFSSFGVGFNF